MDGLLKLLIFYLRLQGVCKAVGAEHAIGPAVKSGDRRFNCFGEFQLVMKAGAVLVGGA